MLFHFWFTMSTSLCQRDVIIYLQLYEPTFIPLSTHMFFFCFYPWTYKLNVQTSNCKSDDIFIIAVLASRNFFSAIYPLFVQILITCLKCFRASFRLSVIAKFEFAANFWVNLGFYYYSWKPGYDSVKHQW